MILPLETRFARFRRGAYPDPIAPCLKGYIAASILLDFFIPN